MKAEYLEKLDWYKQNEKPETVLMIADDDELIKIIIAWTTLEVKNTKELSEINSNSENEIWEWLWGNSLFSLGELKTKIGASYSESVLENKINPLISNRILYPDGTINSYVQRYLRAKVLKLFEAKPKKSTRKQENAEG